jgi:hypothetical protein
MWRATSSLDLGAISTSFFWSTTPSLVGSWASVAAGCRNNAAIIREAQPFFIHLLCMLVPLENEGFVQLGFAPVYFNESS